MACSSLYPAKAVGKGRLGEAPNKYCYRAKCRERGEQLGHVRPSKRSSPVGTSGGAPSPTTMERGGEQQPADRPAIFGVAKLDEVQAVYGFRLVARHLYASLCPHLHACLRCPGVCLRRSIDPTRMTERQRRNEMPDEDLFPDSEILVFGRFKEDDGDEGFLATRWVRSVDMDDLDGALSMLEDLVGNVRSMLVPEEEAF